MSAVATTLTKFQIGAAASAIAVATVLTPVVAHAAPAAPLPQSLGSDAGELLCDIFPSAGCTQGAPIMGSFLWLGSQDPTPPPFTTIFSFQPLTLLPTFIQPLFGWFNNINLELCVGGLAGKIGPYGTVSVSLGSGC